MIEIKTCSDYPGDCCGSCHDDVEYGYRLLEVYDKEQKLIAMVCCRKIDEAEKNLMDDEKVEAP